MPPRWTQSPTGSRRESCNQTLFRYGCRLRALGMDDDEIALHLHALNATYCRPPLGQAEVDKIAAQVCRYRPGRSSGIKANKSCSGGLSAQVEVRDVGPARYFDGGRFVPRRLAQELDPGRRYLYAAEQFWEYRDGVYRAVDVHEIERTILEKLGEEATPHRIGQVIELLEDMAYVPAHELNRHEGLINVENGMLDWKTGELRGHSPEYRSTLRIPVHYDPQAICPRILAFLFDVLPDRATVELMLEWFGYLLLPTNRLQKMMVTFGPGSNGKGVLNALAMRFVGPDNCAAVPLKDLAENRFSAAELYGKLLNVTSEFDEAVLRSTSMLKRLTGEDRIQAERKFRDPFTFYSFARLMFATNHLPRTKDTSHGYFRRLIVVPMTNEYPEERRDPNLIRKLATPEQLSGLLNHALRGLRRLMRRGYFRTPDVCRQALGHYQQQSDTVRLFVEEQCVVGEQHRIVRSRWYEAYRSWCQDNGYPPVSAHTAYERLEALGIRLIKNRDRLLVGITLQEDADTQAVSSTAGIALNGALAEADGVHVQAGGD